LLGRDAVGGVIDPLLLRAVPVEHGAKMGLLYDSVLVVSTQFVFFLIGWLFFVKKLFRDYELRHRFVQLIFCVNFSLACTMFELIIFEIADCLEKNSRYFHWYLAIYLSLFMVILLTPLYIFYFLLSNSGLVRSQWLRPLAVVTWFVWFAAFWKMGDPFPIHNPKHGVLSVETWYVIRHLSEYLPTRGGRLGQKLVLGIPEWLISRFKLKSHQNSYFYNEEPYSTASVLAKVLYM
jgi:hypothetical protein